MVRFSANNVVCWVILQLAIKCAKLIGASLGALIEQDALHGGLLQNMLRVFLDKTVFLAKWS